MKIEAGKKYPRRDGTQSGQVKDYNDPLGKAKFSDGTWTYMESGKWAGSHIADGRDLIIEGPVRTVTRKEIVNGNYGIISVCSAPHPVGAVLVHMDRSSRGATQTELRAAAAVLIELAEALEE